MTYVSDSRTTIRQDISGFVVAEDQSLEARLKRSYQAARDKAQHSVGQVRETVGALKADKPDLAGSLSRYVAGLTTSMVERLRPGRFWQDQDKTLAAMAQESGPDIGLGERLRDAAALVGAVCASGARLFWRLPAGLKVTTFVIALITGAVLATGEGDGPVAGQDTPPATHSIRAPADVPVSRFDLEQWKPVAAPIAAFHLEAPELDRSTMRYRARAHADGARQELLVWGGSGAPDAHRKKMQMFGALSIEHYPRSAPEGDTLYVDVVRRAALAGAGVERVGAPIGLQTKFGTFETADATLITDGVRRGCLAYRHVADAVPMQIHGWFCGAPDRPVDRSALGCMLDRIDLLSAGNDKVLRAYFASVERARQPCGTARLVSTKSSWLDPAGPMPVLKAGFSAQ